MWIVVLKGLSCGDRELWFVICVAGFGVSWNEVMAAEGLVTLLCWVVACRWALNVRLSCSGEDVVEEYEGIWVFDAEVC